MRRLEVIQEEFKHFKNTLQDIKQDRKILKSEEKLGKNWGIYTHTLKDVNSEL